ncbi:D-alanine--D-alanine ligase [Helicobacter bizzozeronii]|uniref:D-alanine--D-alanine ligase n=1 Tax=Helicobacter bizzozeronii TaxID=56877 RepID=UPI000CF0218A|nr:D-alanine--D-alanine ligase [Helicobacter bizzozeronii]
MEYGLLFGGKSYEHEISIVSAIVLKQVLGTQIAHFIFLDGAHRFYLIAEKDMRSQFFSSGHYKKCPELILKHQGFHMQGLLGSKPINMENLINLIHGGDGEDGKIASFLEFYGIDFIGPRVEACVMSYNKYFTKMLAKEKGINTLPYVFLDKREGSAIKGLSYPLIIKPNRLGSSIGISILKDEKDIEYVLDEVFEFDSQVIIESFKEGVKEYNLAGCMVKKGGDDTESEFIFSVVEEPKKKEFLGFEEKYLDFGRTQKVKKADISSELEMQMRALFKRIYEPLFVGAIIRCDFFVINDEIYLNEINPIPGSLAHYLFEDFSSVLEQVILPKEVSIPITYHYIEQIQKAK